ncbi:Bifunctional dTDP-4-dehydrorhamnose 3,5-epimerase/dTDP-4-dehydrorhamnose reductase [Hibiscus syriacus]|uniref:Bifunctional dTDP-4-dehydrorhamnose 3,5-epimerase/dTDP-4-dehydrorhamnose reductase n=1 Tax=Hibiscus syriacus TaxID=106335 RepID=A0A6A2ZL14_HIBSY|nr:Bifunctional dTDP-4-dehydrorhamnose 3,5-epimerase/dTDP-4-dehydrorhamnose reductase [Hibiscus syriacus]
MDWQKLFQCSTNQQLSYFPPNEKNGVPTLRISQQCKGSSSVYGKICSKVLTFSTIGFPLSMDSVTATKIRLEFPKKSLGFPLVAIYVILLVIVPKTVKTIQTPPIQLKYGGKKDPSTSDSSGNNSLASANEVNPYSVKGNIAGSSIPPHLPFSSSYSIDPVEDSLPVEDSHPSTLLTSMEIKNEPAFVTTIETDSNKGSKYPVKKGRGRPPKGKLAKSLAGSSNRFEIFNSVEEATQALETMEKKPRVAASGVVELIKDLKSKNKSHLDKFLLTGIYGHNDRVATRSLWQDLRVIESRYPNYPWILGGDFNVTMYPHKSSNHEHMAPGSSDHCLALVNLNKEIQFNKPKPFKIFNCWTLHHIFLNIFSQYWYPPCQGNPMKKLFLKLKRLKSNLKQLNKESFSDISARVREKQEEIEKQKLLSLRGLEPIEKELRLQRELKTLEDAEAMFLKKKAKTYWLKEWDKNSKFFYYVIATKNKKDTIRALIDHQGRRLDTFKDMSTEIIKFFKNLLDSTDPKVTNCSVNLLKDLLNPIPRSENYQGITNEVTSQEIYKAIYGQGNDKAPGPDGYTPLFFNKAWHVIGEEVIEAIKFFFQESIIYHAFNATSIALVPKISNPCKVSDYRPISYCSVIYKAITKIIVKRINFLLPQIISPNQSTFVKGRSIVDNSLLAQDIVKGYGRKKHLSLALDLPTSLINWIIACYSNASYSITFNGSLIGFFKAAKGFRQGDPLSPLLFVLVMNVLSKMLNTAAAKGIFNFHPKCKKIGLTHLTFADDLLIFCKGSDIPTSGARVSWERICMPKSEGGLGIKGIKSWNKVCTIIHIKNLLAGEGSLWVAWTHKYIIKQQNFWSMDIPSTSSWTLRRIMKLRQLAYPILSAGFKCSKSLWEEHHHLDDNSGSFANKGQAAEIWFWKARREAKWSKTGQHLLYEVQINPMLIGVNLTSVVGTLILADVFREHGLWMMNFATGCIFEYDAEHPQGSAIGFKEEDKPNFTGSLYSKTKAMFEELLKEYNNVCTLRVRMPISSNLNNPHNFITKISRYRKAVNIPNSMTILDELLPISIEMAKRNLRGIWNLTNPGVVSHNEMYKKYIDPKFQWVNCTLE